MGMTRRQFLLIVLGYGLSAPRQAGAEPSTPVSWILQPIDNSKVTASTAVYSGPLSIRAEAGTAIDFAQYWSTSDGRPLTFSMNVSDLGSIDADGLFMPSKPGSGTITIYVDDGKP